MPRIPSLAQVVSQVVPLVLPLVLSLVLSLASMLSAQQAPSQYAPRVGEPTTAVVHELDRLGLSVADVRTVLADGRVSRVGLDADGTWVDVDRLRRQEHALSHAARGQMAPTLAARIATMPVEQPIEVAFWLDEPEDGVSLVAELRARTEGVPEAQVGDVVRAARLAVRDIAVARYAPGNASFAAAVEAAGGQVLLVGTAWPLVIAELPAGWVAGLAADPRVDEAYLSQPTWEDEGNFAQGTLRTPVAHFQGAFADGSVRVMVNDTSQVQVGNPWLPPVTTLNVDSTASHATGVAGNICNIHPTYHAAAFTLPTIYSAGGNGDIEAPIVWDLAILAGIDFGNCSWWNLLKGQIEFLDRFFDHTIRNFGVMMFKSNGNQGNSGTPYATTPGNGYNVTCSGAYSDGNSWGWADDAMASSSSYWNPLEGHEKPEVASPGTDVTTTGTGPSGLQSGFGGTSSASPLTASIAAVIASNDNTLLAEMTSVKATIMASAWHNVEGAALLSDKDGAGGTHLAAAWAAVRDGQRWYDDVVEADFVGNVLDVSIDLLAGDEVRVCALWFSNPDAAYATDVLDMDLDMTLLDPGGAVIASSVSALNPFELLSVVPTLSGRHTVRLSKQRFDGTIEPLTVAWSTRADTATGRIEVDSAGPRFSAGAVPTLRFSEFFEGAGRTYVAWASLGGPTGVPLGGGYAVPSGIDAVALWSVTLPGFIGVLDGTGLATAAFELAPNPSTIGLPLHFGLVVMGPSGILPDIETVADDTVFIVQP